MNHRKIFYQAVIPSMLAFALSGIYSVADGFFVGNSLGDNALAAINIAYPLTAFIQAAGTGIGMGGAVMFAIHNGSGDYSRSRKFFWHFPAASCPFRISVHIIFSWERRKDSTDVRS